MKKIIGLVLAIVLLVSSQAIASLVTMDFSGNGSILLNTDPTHGISETTGTYINISGQIVYDTDSSLYTPELHNISQYWPISYDITFGNNDYHWSASANSGTGISVANKMFYDFFDVHQTGTLTDTNGDSYSPDITASANLSLLGLANALNSTALPDAATLDAFNGNLNFSFIVNDGCDNVLIITANNLRHSATNTVPIPASFFLLAPGLFGFLLIRRKKS